MAGDKNQPGHVRHMTLVLGGMQFVVDRGDAPPDQASVRCFFHHFRL